MKKILSLLLSALLISILSISSFADSSSNSRLNDNADLLSDEQEQEIVSLLDSLSKKYQFDIVIVTEEDTGSKSMEAYADDYFDYNDFGFGSKHDGALLLIDMGERGWHISGCGSGEKIINSVAISNIGDEISPYLSDGNYSEAFNKYANLCEKYIVDANNGIYASKDRPIITPMAIIVILIIALICGAIGASSLKSQLKSVRKNDLAFAYTSEEKFNVTDKRDIYLYSTVTREKKASSDSGSHTSSSGRSHSGGGGHF